MSLIVSRRSLALGSTLEKLLTISAHVRSASLYCAVLVWLVINEGGFIDELGVSDDVAAGPIIVRASA